METITVKNKKITWSKVESSNLKEVSYQPNTERLYVKFNKGSVYAYDNFTSEAWSEFNKAQSKGGYLAKNIVGLYPTSKVTLI